MFYGFADSTTQANGILSSLGATTSAVAQMPAGGTSHVVPIRLKDAP